MSREWSHKQLPSSLANTSPCIRSNSSTRINVVLTIFIYVISRKLKWRNDSVVDGSIPFEKNSTFDCLTHIRRLTTICNNYDSSRWSRLSSGFHEHSHTCDLHGHTHKHTCTGTPPHTQCTLTYACTYTSRNIKKTILNKHVQRLFWILFWQLATITFFKHLTWC